MSSSDRSYRILVIDDTRSIHDDYRKVLCKAPPSQTASDVRNLEAFLFGDDAATAARPASDTNEPTLEVDSAYQGEEGLAKLRVAIAESRPYAMAFVDMRMPPGWDGLRTIKELWQLDRDLQIVICTAYSDYSPADIQRELNLTDRMLILRKPFDGLEVRQVAMTLCEKWHVRQHRDALSSLVDASTEELRRAALHDQLTGLPNRTYFNDRLAAAVRSNRRFATLFIDTDNFKLVNDSLGHEAGDELLVELSRRLTRALLEAGPAAGCAMAARLGGDEFAVLLDGIESDDAAEQVAKRVLGASAAPYEIAGRSLHFSLSIGLTTSTRGYAKPEDVLRDADAAMYAAKRKGRGRLAAFDPKMHAEAMARLTLEADLRAAIVAGQIDLHYQPIVRLDSARPIGFEALARWRHPQRGWVPPLEFIPIAEENGAIVPLGFHILTRACRQLADWHRRFPADRDMTMSVNVSRKQLLVPDLAQRVEQTLAETGLEPRHLKLEITESMMMQDPHLTLPVLRRISDLHIPLHIDDFGTGHSSLSTLQAFPMKGLKIDRDFVSGVTTNPGQATIVRAIIALAHSLRLPLVAEGVETEDQRTALLEMGCDQAQGYLFAKPMDADATTHYLTRQLSPTTAAA